MTTKTEADGCPECEGRNRNNNRRLAAPNPPSPAELRRWVNRERQRAIDDYMHAPRQRPGSGRGWTLDLRWVLTLAGLIGISLVLGAGCKTPAVIPPVVSGHADAIRRLAD